MEGRVKQAILKEKIAVGAMDQRHRRLNSEKGEERLNTFVEKGLTGKT